MTTETRATVGELLTELDKGPDGWSEDVDDLVRSVAYQTAIGGPGVAVRATRAVLDWLGGTDGD